MPMQGLDAIGLSARGRFLMGLAATGKITVALLLRQAVIADITASSPNIIFFVYHCLFRSDGTAKSLLTFGFARSEQASHLPPPALPSVHISPRDKLIRMSRQSE